MFDHIVALLDAYLDGELNSTQHKKVEMHLEECQACQAEMDTLQALSAMLLEDTLPDFASPEQLAANVALHLPRTPVKSVEWRVLEFGWWLAPVGLLLAWIFISTTAFVSNALSAAGNFGLLNSTFAWIASGSPVDVNFAALLGKFGWLEQGSLQRVTVSEGSIRALISSVFWQVSIAMLYLSWIAIWWARQTHRGLGQPLES